MKKAALSVNERLAELKQILKMSGLDIHIKKDKHAIAKLAENRAIIADSGENPSLVELNFYSMLKTARDVCEEDFNWFMRVISDPTRTYPFHEVEEQFILYGPSALPQSYRCAEQYGAIFQWHADPTVVLSLYPRGFGKSTRGTGRGLHNFIKNPHHKALILHGDKDKVNTLLRGIALMMGSPGASVLWPEFFNMSPEFYKEVGTKILKEKIDIKIDPAYTGDGDRSLFGTGDGIRRESTFTTGSPQIDRTGLHFDIGFFDDLVGDLNSRTRKMQDELCVYFDSLFGLEEYRPDEKDHHMTLLGVGTRWRGPGLYQHIIDDHRSTVFQLPLSWDDVPSVTYSYHRHRVADFVTDDFIDRKKAELRTLFDSQMYMIEMPLDGDMHLDVPTDIVFCCQDDTDAPESVPRIGVTMQYLIDTGCTVVAKDPSYSEEGKDARQIAKGVSQDTTLGAAVTNGVGYIIREFQQKGGNENTLYEPFANMIKDLRADYWCFDRVGPQRILADIFESRINKEIDWTSIQLRLPRDVSRMGKADRAVLVLNELLKMRTIRIHWRCVKTLNELRRVTQGTDFIDCLVQIFAFSIETYSLVSEQKQAAYRLEKQKKPDTISTGRRVIFPITGY